MPWVGDKHKILKLILFYDICIKKIKNYTQNIF
jgi:hypothetical protein